MIGRIAPDFEATAFHGGKMVKTKLSDYRGRWVVLFFYPADFTFVCPTELAGFSDSYSKFTAEGAEVIAVSTDTEFTHKAWVEADKRLNGIKYPLVADRTGSISKSYGVFDEASGNARRGLFIIDPEGVIKYIVMTHDDVGRSTDETFRVLKALQTGGLCPVNWKPGEGLLTKH